VKSDGLKKSRRAEEQQSSRAAEQRKIPLTVPPLQRGIIKTITDYKIPLS